MLQQIPVVMEEIREEDNDGTPSRNSPAKLQAQNLLSSFSKGFKLLPTQKFDQRKEPQIHISSDGSSDSELDELKGQVDCITRDQVQQKESMEKLMAKVDQMTAALMA